MAGVKITKEAVKVCFKAGVVPFLWGAFGVGKSSIAKQVTEEVYGECREKGKDVNFIDLRLGNLEVGDLIGLPMEKQMEKVMKTIFAIPEYWPEGGEGVLFLDEFNRAQQVVLQACFSLVLDRKIHGYHLPDGWKVIAAGNPPNDDYIVNEIDAALFSRFCHLIYEPTKEDWLEYGRETKKIHQGILSFIDEKGDTHLFGADKVKIDESIQVHQNPRSYEMLSRVMEQFDWENNLNLLRIISFGLIGKTSTTTLVAHLQESDKPLKGNEILDSYEKSARAKVKKWTGSSSINMSIINATCQNVIDEIHKRLNNDKDYFASKDAKYDLKDDVVKKSKDNYSIYEEAGKKKVAIINDELNNVAAFLMDIPLEMCVTFVKRDLQKQHDGSKKKDDTINMIMPIRTIMRYFFGHEKLKNILNNAAVHQTKIK